MSVIGSYALCNAGSINIYKIEFGIDDCVLAGLNNGKPAWFAIRYDVDSRPYFMFDELQIHLDECMRNSL